MNIVLPVDYQNFVPTSNASGTEQARIENTNRPAIEPTQQNSAAKKQTQDNAGQSNSQPKQSDVSSKDKVSLSNQGQALHAQELDKQKNDKGTTSELSEEDEKKVQELKDRDREVRIHEQAHAAVGGQYAGAPSYEFESGPDGKRYAVGGEVSIDVSEESEPEDTVQKMQVVRAAALAPAEPSTQDLKVAAEASQKEQKARAQISQSQLTPQNEDGSSADETKSSVYEQQSKLAKYFSDSSANRITSQFSISA